MKLKIVSIIALCSLPVIAQTTVPGGTTLPAPAQNATASATNIVQVLGMPSSIQQLASDAASAFVDAQPYFSNNIAEVDTGLLYNKSLPSGNFGTFLDANVPVSQQAAVGFGGAYIGNQFYDCTINLKMGTTATLPLLGKVYNYVASGPDYNFSQHEIGAYNFVGQIKTWDINPKWKFSAGWMVGDISTLGGLTYGLTFSLNLHW